MRWSDLQFSPSTRTLRQFAFLWILVLGLIAGWQYFVHARHLAGGILATLAVTIAVPGLIWPQAIRPVYIAATVITFPIGLVISRLLLATVFYGVFTPLGLAFKLLGRDALRCRRLEAHSYWQAKPQPKGLASYLRQF